MKCKITKISRPDTAEGTGFRTDTIVGETDALPEEGKCFEMTAPPLEFGVIRMVNTSPIVNMTLITGGYSVTTMSGSVYEIEINESLDNDTEKD